MTQRKIIFIVGPTAVGKSDVAYYLAESIGGEIVSCDSMQVYKEVAIASGKVSEEMLKSVKHYLVDQVSVEEEFDVGLFNQLAVDAIKEIHQKGKTPVIVGGSGMYMQILLDGIFDGVGKDVDFRKKLKNRIEDEGEDFLFEELKQVDPQTAARIHPHDIKRLLRALEIYHNTQRPIGEIQEKRKGLWGEYDIFLFCLHRERAKLYERINARVDKMFEQGLIDEIKSLDGLSLSQTAQAIIGIKEVRALLKEECTLEEAKEDMKQNTRRFAKRQLTWFRKEKRLQWIELNDEVSCQQASQLIQKQVFSI